MSFLSLLGLDWQRTIPLPIVRLKRMSVIIAVVIAVIGWWLASVLCDSLWFQRFGSLIVLSAVLFAYFGQLNGSDIEEWAKNVKQKTEVDAQLKLQIDYREDSLSQLPATLRQSDQLAIYTATGLESSKTAEGSVWLVMEIANNPNYSDSLSQYLNRQLRKREIIVGGIGTIIWGFGDVLHALVAGQ